MLAEAPFPDRRPPVPLPATIAVILAVSLSSFAALGLVPVLPQMAKAFGGRSDVATLVVTLPLLAAALVTATLGVVGDRLPRRGTFIAAAGLYAVAAPSPFFFDALPLVIAARFLTGLAIGGLVATSLGLIGDLFTAERRAVLVSAQSAIAAIMTIGGTALNGVLGREGWHYAFLIYLIGLPVFAMAFFIPHTGAAAASAETREAAARVPFPWRGTAIVYVLAIVGVLLVVPAAYELGFLLTERGIGGSVMIGNMAAVISIGGAIGAAALSLIRKVPPLRAVGLCFVLSGVGQGLVVFAGTALPVLGLGVLLFGAGQGLFLSFMALWLLNSIDGAVRGRATGLFRTLLYICGFAGPQVARAVARGVGSSATVLTFYVAALIVLALVLAALSLRRNGAKPARVS